MKTVITCLLIGLFLGYLLGAMGSHTWDVMKFSYGSTFTFGASTLFFVVLGLLLGILKPFDN